MGTISTGGVFVCEGCGGLCDLTEMRGYNGKVLCPSCCRHEEAKKRKEEEERIREYCATHLPEGESFVQMMPFKGRVLILSTNSIFELTEEGLKPIRFVAKEVA